MIFMTWECTQCGRCCKMIVSIDGEDIKKIEALGYNNFTQEHDGEIILKRKESKCVFLTDNKCSIQIKHGYENKPNICRRFPDNSIGVNQVVCGKFSGDVEVKSSLKKFTFLY
ncbi:MAG: YkgJ family cysteine cluster protein, partial [Candidatus Aenigmarchaeota archaeon]|nr:YkgJ family cysteine cluster protein [Candidatus Aenigmarchaeota archaeon]